MTYVVVDFHRIICIILLYSVFNDENQVPTIIVKIGQGLSGFESISC